MRRRTPICVIACTRVELLPQSRLAAPLFVHSQSVVLLLDIGGRVARDGGTCSPAVAGQKRTAGLVLDAGGGAEWRGWPWMASRRGMVEDWRLTWTAEVAQEGRGTFVTAREARPREDDDNELDTLAFFSKRCGGNSE